MERIRQKIGRIAEHLAIIRTIKDDCTTRFSTDPVYRGALLHYLYLLSDGCVVPSVVGNKAQRVAHTTIICGIVRYSSAKIKYLKRHSPIEFSRALQHSEIFWPMITRRLIRKSSVARSVSSLDDVDVLIRQIRGGAVGMAD